jgi:hypothetical protein
MAGLAACVFMVAALLRTWSVSPRASVHDLTVLGQRFSYPAANAEALVVLTLASAGFAVLLLAVVGAAREAVAARRLQCRLRAVTERSTGRGDVVVIDDGRLLAFCAGLVRPRVYISRAVIERLDERAVAAVLAHERHHARRRDPLRLATRQVLSQALFFVPGLSALHRRQELLSELAADAWAIDCAPQGRASLAQAMLCFDESGAVDPRRADHLLGELARWSLPLGLLAAASGAIALFAALGILAARLAHGSTTLALPFVSSRPCVIVLALIPLVAAGGALLGRPRRP